MNDNELFNLLCIKLADHMLERISKQIDDAIEEKLDEHIEKVINALIDVPISIDTAAEILGESKDALYKRNSRGSMKFNKVKGKLFISLREIYENLLQGKQGR